MAAWEDLCPDVLLLVLARVADLRSLHSLLAASPTALRVFSAHPGAVVEAVLAAAERSSPSSSRQPTAVSELVRAVVLTRAGVLPVTSFDGLVAGFLRHGGKLPLPPAVPLPSSPPLPTCKDGLPPSPIVLGPGSLTRRLATTAAHAVLVRRVVATAARLSLLTHACLDHYLERARADRQAGRLPPRHPCGCALDVASPPSWAETMRVDRALWTIQLCRDLQQAAADGRLLAGGASSSSWPADDVALMARTGPEELADRAASVCGAQEEIFAVQAFLDELHDRSGGGGMLPAGEARETPCPNGDDDGDDRPEVPPGINMFRQCEHDNSHTLTGGGGDDDDGMASDPYARLGYALWDQSRMRRPADILQGRRDGYWAVVWRRLQDAMDIAG